MSDDPNYAQTADPDHSAEQPQPAPAEDVHAEPMTKEDSDRLAELRTRPQWTSVTEDERGEMARLEAKAAASRGRLIFLRAKDKSGDLTDAERQELDERALFESDAAGHVVPEATRHDPALALIEGIIAAFEHVADAVPQAAGLRGYIRAMRAQLDAAKPPADAA